MYDAINSKYTYPNTCVIKNKLNNIIKINKKFIVSMKIQEETNKYGR